MNPAPHYRNLTEPQAYARLFELHPPKDFEAGHDAHGTPVFRTEFNLLTTLDEGMERVIRKLPLFRFWSRILKVTACFCGTTTTEHLPIPDNVTPGEFLDTIHRTYASKQPLLIIKDLPRRSPFVTPDDNAFTRTLTRLARKRGYVAISGQALAYIPIDFTEESAFLARLSASRRKNIRRKLRSRAVLDIEEIPLGDERFLNPAVTDEFYELFLQVFNNSDVHFDLLTKDYLTTLLRSRDIPGVVFRYAHKGVTVAYNLCLLHKKRLIDKYIALRYPLSRELNVYHVSWMVNLEYARTHDCTSYISGGTAVEVKASLGSSFTVTRHLVWVRNPILRRLVRFCSGLFEADVRILKKV